jgi:hypothetical protein
MFLFSVRISDTPGTSQFNAFFWRKSGSLGYAFTIFHTTIYHLTLQTVPILQRTYAHGSFDWDFKYFVKLNFLFASQFEGSMVPC